MSTLKRYWIWVALTVLALMLVLPVGNLQAGPTRQGETDFAAIDAYVAGQVKDLGLPGLALGIVQDGQIAHLRGFCVFR